VASYAASAAILGLSFLLSDAEPGRPFRVIVFFLASFSFMQFVAILAVIPTALAIMVIRISRVPRGYAEIVAGAICAIILARPFANPATGDPPKMLSGQYCADTFPFILAGAVAGLVYWLVNGRPTNSGMR